MKKETLRTLVAAAILLAVYNLIVFLIPFERYEVFWISYGFTLVALVVAGGAVYHAVMKDPKIKSRFYGFPIARIGVIYGLIQVAVSLVAMAAGEWIPGWAAALVYAIGLAAALLGLMGAETVRDEIEAQDEKLKKNVALMRALQSKMQQVASQTEDPAVKALAEDFRYSDPVSNEANAQIEKDLEAAVDMLQSAVIDGDAEAASQLCRRTAALLAERNRLCKLNK